MIAWLAEALARTGRFQADDKILDVAIALERMYELDRSEISFKLKTRAACFLRDGNGSSSARVARRCSFLRGTIINRPQAA